MKFKGNEKSYRRTYMKKYRITHKTEISENRKKIYIKNNGVYHKEYLTNKKNKLFEILDMFECIKCGFSDKRILHFDHINGGGKEDSRRFKNHGSMIQYYILHPDEARKTLQVLCPNCNWLKRIENNECRKCNWRIKIVD
jgi:hypothetical protein